MDINEQIRGSLFGIAVGDALGVPLVGSTQSRIRISDMIGGGPYKLPPGQWTDETGMTLCLLESIIEHGGYSLDLAKNNYIKCLNLIFFPF